MTENLVKLVAALLAVVCLYRAYRRLQLSFGKHPSLTGHSRMAKRVAGWLPRLSYGRERFFNADEVPVELAERREQGFERLGARLAERHPKSIAQTVAAADHISDLQFTRSYQVPFQFSRYFREHLKLGGFVASTDGVCVTDLDGRPFYDLTGAYGVNVMGYKFYKECMAEAAERARALGPVLGSLHPCVAWNAEQLCRISGKDEVSFHMSGTEAVMQAVRLARYHTGKNYLVRFCGAYHGWWDDVQPGPGNPMPPGKTYTLSEMGEGALRVLRTRKDIACVLVNPLQALNPNKPAPSDGTLVDSGRTARFDRAAYTAWLRKLREVCTARRIVLIFDEVFLGFRIAPGGAQEYFGVQADMVTYGKTLGGGFPIGVVCGRGDLMKRYREGRPADICFARGTFNSHPYVMAAMQVFLERLDTKEVQALYHDFDAVWDERAARLNNQFQSADLPVRVANFSTVWTVLYTRPSRYNWMFQFYLRAEELALSWVGTGRIIFSLNFSDADFEAVASRFVRAAEAMKKDCWWTDAGLTNKAIRRGILKEMIRQRFTG